MLVNYLQHFLVDLVNTLILFQTLAQLEQLSSKLKHTLNSRFSRSFAGQLQVDFCGRNYINIKQNKSK